jgi:arginase family enzyme
MSLDYLQPLVKDLLPRLDALDSNSVGYSMEIYGYNSEDLPELEERSIALLSVGGSAKNQENKYYSVRSEFYQLFKGNWISKIVDLGHLFEGETDRDTQYALSQICEELLMKKVIPVVLGSNHRFTYSCYRAYDNLEQTVNLCSVDSKFNFGAFSDEIKDDSFLSSIIMDEPNNLFNFSNIGFQTYLVPQTEVDLIEGLGFDAYRLGEAKNLKSIEPICRDADIVSIDLEAIRSSDSPAAKNIGPNGFYGDEVCAISRYAGISDKLSLFGIFGFDQDLDVRDQSAKLIAQMIWYFTEGVNFRANDFPFGSKTNYFKYIVPHEDDGINFYKSDKTDRWWMEVEINSISKHSRHSLVPCSYEDYLEACDQQIPERWYRAQKKLA